MGQQRSQVSLKYHPANLCIGQNWEEIMYKIIQGHRCRGRGQERRFPPDNVHLKNSLGLKWRDHDNRVISFSPSINLTKRSPCH